MIHLFVSILIQLFLNRNSVVTLNVHPQTKKSPLVRARYGRRFKGVGAALERCSVTVAEAAASSPSAEFTPMLQHGPDHNKMVLVASQHGVVVIQWH